MRPEDPRVSSADLRNLGTNHAPKVGPIRDTIAPIQVEKQMLIGVLSEELSQAYYNVSLSGLYDLWSSWPEVHLTWGPQQQPLKVLGPPAPLEELLQWMRNFFQVKEFRQHAGLPSVEHTDHWIVSSRSTADFCLKHDLPLREFVTSERTASKYATTSLHQLDVAAAREKALLPQEQQLAQ